MFTQHLIKKIIILISSISLSLVVSGCARVGATLNPFAEKLPSYAYAGNPNDHALTQDGGSVDKARSALQGLGRYPRAHQPKPQNPVIQPSVVRLMWIPDHLNKHGDLVPAHFYYLKVLEDRWAVTDVYEQHELVSGGGSGGRSSSSHLPFTTK